MSQRHDLSTRPPPLMPADGQVRQGLAWGSWVELLRERAAQRPDEVCLYGSPNLVDLTRSLSWAQLDRRARAVAAAVQQRTAPGEHCLLLLDNDPDYVIAFFACAYAGRIGVTLHVPTQKKHATRLGQVAADCGARMVLSTAALRGRFGQAVDEAVPGAEWLAVDGVSDALALAWEPRPRPRRARCVRRAARSPHPPGRPRGRLRLRRPMGRRDRPRRAPQPRPARGAAPRHFAGPQRGPTGALVGAPALRARRTHRRARPRGGPTPDGELGQGGTRRGARASS